MNMIYEFESKDRDVILDTTLKYHLDDPNGALYNLGMRYDSLTKSQKEELLKQLDFIMALMDTKNTRFSEKDNKKFWSKDTGSPTDWIVLKKKEDLQKLMNFWKPQNYSNNGCPNDLVMDKTVPIEDIVFTFEDYDPFNENDTGNPFKLTTRIFLFKDYGYVVDSIKSADSDTYVSLPVGGIELNYTYKKDAQIVAYPIFINNKYDILIFNMTAYKNIDRNKLENLSYRWIQQSCSELMEIWYGLQLTLLNPITEEVVIKAKEHPISERKIVEGKGIKHRKVKYIKKYYFSFEDVETLIEKHRTHKVKCPFWYVIGHWRQYKNGQKVWIKGYFKGVDRHKVDHLSEHMKTNIRERIADMRAAIPPQETEDK